VLPGAVEQGLHIALVVAHKPGEQPSVGVVQHVGEVELPTQIDADHTLTCSGTATRPPLPVASKKQTR
jgi:hypothetical protein